MFSSTVIIPAELSSYRAWEGSAHGSPVYPSFAKMLIPDKKQAEDREGNQNHHNAQKEMIQPGTRDSHLHHSLVLRR